MASFSIRAHKDIVMDAISQTGFIGLAILAAVALFSLATLAPRSYLIFFMAVMLLLPMSSGLQISPDLPIIFFSRPILLIGLAGLILRRLMGSEHEGERNPLIIPLLITLFGFALSLPRSIELHKSLFKFISLLFEWLGFVLLAWDGVKDRKDCQFLINWLFGIFALICLIGLAEFAFGFDIHEMLSTGYTPIIDYFQPVMRGELARIRSTFPHSIDYGAALTMITPLLLVYVLYSEGFPRLFYTGLGVLVLANLALTASTGPLLGLLVILSVMYIYNEGRQAIKLALVLCTFIVAILIQSPEVREVLEITVISKFDPASEGFVTTAGRVAVLLAAWQSFQLHPIFGTGLNTWFAVGPEADFMGVSSLAGMSGGNENFYAQVLLETGVVGLAGVLLALYLLLQRVRGFIIAAEEPWDRAVYVAVFSAMCGFLAQSFTAGVFWGGSGQTSLVFWLILVFCLRYAQEAPASLSSRSSEVQMVPT